MQPVMYSHRLKGVLQHTVRELCLTMSLANQESGVSLAQNEAMIRKRPRFSAFRWLSNTVKTVRL